MSTVSKVALGVALAGLASGFIGSTKLVIGGLLVAAGSYAWSRWVTPLFS